MSGRFAVGVDLGGTKMLAAVVDLENGKILGIGKKKTRLGQTKDEILDRIIAVINESLDSASINRKQLRGIGIGAAGQVDREKGVLIAAANIGISDMRLTDPVGDHFKMPCLIANDLEIATNGELNFGAGTGCDSFICIFVGTGIGSGIVQGGRIYRGATGTAGEIGHIVIEPFGRACGCGATGCLEAYASRMAIARRIVAEIESGCDSTVKEKVNPDKGILRSRAIAEAVAANDPVVTRQVKQGAEYMGLGLATVMNLLNPQKIILGGGLIEEVDIYYRKAIKAARHRALKVPARGTEFVRAKLGDYSGVIGAALLVGDSPQ